MGRALPGLSPGCPDRGLLLRVCGRAYRAMVAQPSGFMLRTDVEAKGSGSSWLRP
jgi:hypothetical protein